MSRISEAHAWARRQFGSADLKDRRRTRRLVVYAAAAALDPAASIPDQCGSWAAAKAAYRLFAGDSVCYERVMRGHWAETRQAAGACCTVLFIQDSTTLCFDHPETTGLGPNSAGGDGGVGMLLHSTLVVDMSGKEPLPIGLAGGQLWARREQRNEQRPESCKWPDAITAAGRPVEGSHWVHVGDAESDCWEAFEAAEAQAVQVVLRSGQDRLAWEGHDESGHKGASEKQKLWGIARAAPPLACKWIHARRRPGREPGRVRLCVSAAPVKLLPPKNWSDKPHRSSRSKPPPLRLWAVRVWEAEPAEGQEPIEWVLLSNRPVATAEQALEVTRWYACRWLIEEYHKCLKTGCRVEQRQLQDAGRLAPLVGVLSAVAVRLLRLKFLARVEPDAPAESAVRPKYVRALAAYRGLRTAKLGMRVFWVEVAKLGGFLARKSDGDPGWLTTWRGWQKLEMIAAGFELALDEKERSG